MASVALLHVGEDSCHRIPVMEASGLYVARSECTISGIHSACSEGKRFSVVTFHNDLMPPPLEAVAEARTLTSAPLVLFENPSVSCDERAFNVVITAHTPPEIWLQMLRKTIQNSQKICDLSRQLRTECEEVRAAKSQKLRTAAAQYRIVAFDSMAMWQDVANANPSETIADSRRPSEPEPSR